jgi:TfoX/Sxy family transcriptional regulator of competence genes
MWDEIFLRDRPETQQVNCAGQPHNPYYVGKGRIPSANIFSNNYSVSHYTPENIICASAEQEFLFYCLIASEGPQYSGLAGMTFNDIKETSHRSGKKTIQFNYRKGRGKAKYSTAIHTNKDKPDVFYKSYSIMANLLKESRKFRDTDRRENLFSMKIDQLSKMVFNSIGRDLMSRLVNSNSVMRRELSKRLNDSQLHPFIWLLTKLRNTKKELRSGPIHESMVAITSSTAEKNHLRKAAAHLNAHSEETEMDTYWSRYPKIVKEKLEKTPSLAIRVGQLMTEFADSINNLLKEDEVLNVRDVKMLLGLDHTSDQIENIYGHVDSVGLLGDIEVKNKKIFIATTSTAALILRYLDHIKSELPRVVQHQKTDTKNAQKFLFEFIRLSEVLTKFPENILSEGRKKAGKLPNALFPPLV